MEPMTAHWFLCDTMMFSLVQLLARKDSVLQNAPEVYSTLNCCGELILCLTS